MIGFLEAQIVVCRGGPVVLLVESSQNTRVAQATAYQILISQISEIIYLQAIDDELQSALS
jgi:hypothetical protein